MLFTSLSLAIILISSPTLAASPDLSNSLSIGVGTYYLDAKKPVSKMDYFFNISFGIGLNSYLETLTSLDFGLPEAGEVDKKVKRLFLGSATQTLRGSVGFFSNTIRPGIEVGGGGYLTRHSQPRITEAGGGGQGAKFGPHIRVGATINWYPLIHAVYRWNDLFVQIRGTYNHYFRSTLIERDYGLLLAFGGSF